MQVYSYGKYWNVEGRPIRALVIFMVALAVADSANAFAILWTYLIVQNSKWVTRTSWSNEIQILFLLKLMFLSHLFRALSLPLSVTTFDNVPGSIKLLSFSQFCTQSRPVQFRPFSYTESTFILQQLQLLESGTFSCFPSCFGSPLWEQWSMPLIVSQRRKSWSRLESKVSRSEARLDTISFLPSSWR